MSRLGEDLRDRCKEFGSRIIRFYSGLPKEREEVRILGKQLLRSGTSVAAHAREASRARSDAEFCSKLEGLLQEADESQLWIEYLRDDCQIEGERVEHLYNESRELLAIFTTIVINTKRRSAQT